MNLLKVISAGILLIIAAPAIALTFDTTWCIILGILWGFIIAELLDFSINDLSLPAEKEQVRAYVIGWGGRT